MKQLQVNRAQIQYPKTINVYHINLHNKHISLTVPACGLPAAYTYIIRKNDRQK